MRLILSSPDRRGTGLGLALSVAIHVLLVAAMVIAWRSRPEPGALVDQFITFMVPPPRQQAQDPSTGGVYVGPGGAAGTGSGTGAATPSPTVPATLPADEEGDTLAAASFPLPALVGDSVLTEVEVDSAVQRYPWSAAPEYPPDLLSQNIEGSVSVTYVVDTTGFADSASLRVLDATHPSFADAVRKAIPNMRFRPAVLSGQKVRQLVSQTFSFRIRRPDDAVH